jgi:hypothetical protein
LCTEAVVSDTPVRRGQTRPVSFRLPATAALRVRGSSDCYPNCMKPQIASKAAIAKPIHDRDIGTEYGPMCTAQPLITLIRWAIATAAKISVETAA